MTLLSMLTVSLLLAGAESVAIAVAKPSKIAARDDWTSLGCYTDNASGRSLTYGAQIPNGSGAMTNEACQSACLAAGFQIAGTEYAGECCTAPTAILCFC